MVQNCMKVISCVLNLISLCDNLKGFYVGIIKIWFEPNRFFFESIKDRIFLTHSLDFLQVFNIEGVLALDFHSL
jgi:hypothetical protein